MSPVATRMGLQLPDSFYREATSLLADDVTGFIARHGATGVAWQSRYTQGGTEVAPG